MIDTTRLCEKARRYGIDAAPVARRWIHTRSILCSTTKK